MSHVVVENPHGLEQQVSAFVFLIFGDLGFSPSYAHVVWGRERRSVVS